MNRALGCARVLWLDRISWPGCQTDLVFRSALGRYRKFFAFFDSKDAIVAAEPGFEQQGDTIPEEVRGKRTSVHYYEVVIHDGNAEDANAARVSVLKVRRMRSTRVSKRHAARRYRRYARSTATSERSGSPTARPDASHLSHSGTAPTPCAQASRRPTSCVRGPPIKAGSRSPMSRDTRSRWPSRRRALDPEPNGGLTRNGQALP